MKIGIIGVGAFSTAMAFLLATNKENSIVMWSENEDLVKEFKETKKLKKIWNNKTIPKNINLTNSYEETLEDAEIVFLMTSVNYLENVCKDIKHILPSTTPVCIGTKGIASHGKKLVHEMAHKHLKNKITLLAGPTFANDVAALNPIGFILAGKDKKSRELIKMAFNQENLRIEETIDLNGVAICSCVKNIYAIGSGIIAGLKYNESTQALYLTNVYAELFNILYKYNSSLETLHSLAGFGDLVLTCNSSESRNYSYGEKIAKKTSQKTIEKYLEDNTVEGLNTLEAIYPIFKKKHLKCPIINILYAILLEEEDPKKLISVITKKTTN